MNPTLTPPTVLSPKRNFLLARASLILSGCTDPELALNRAAQIVVPALADWCLIDLFESQSHSKSNETLRRKAVAHASPAEHELAARLRHAASSCAAEAPWPELRSGGALRLSGGALQTALAGWDPSFREVLRSLGASGLMMVPLTSEGQVIGVITAILTGATRAEALPSDLILLKELGYCLGIGLDRAKMLEESRRAVQDREDLICTAAHELRTPLTSLLLKLQLLSRQTAPGSPVELPRESIHSVVASSVEDTRNLAILIDRLLDISQIQAGRTELFREEADLGDAVKTSVARLSDQIAAAQVQVDVSVEAGVRGSFDPIQIGQVVTNLLTNAIKYGRGKQVGVQLERKGDRALVSVRDEGVGIPEAEKDKVFDAFHRASTSKGKRGLGFGLYISRQIVEAHGGSIHVESRVSEGSTFVVNIPLC